MVCFSSILILHHIKAKMLNISFNLFHQPCSNFYFSVDPQSLTGLSREELIKCYFQSGFSYSEIWVFLATFHGINLTMRYLHRLLREQNLFRNISFYEFEWHYWSHTKRNVRIWRKFRVSDYKNIRSTWSWA